MALQNYFIIPFFVISFNFLSQKESNAIFFGINPSFTIEPFYDKGEFDVNILPIVFQKPISSLIDIRFTTILNLGIRNGNDGVSHIGLETSLPFYFKRKIEIAECSEGLFLAPSASFTTNRIENEHNFSIWLEPGYQLLFDNKFALSFGLQFGKTLFFHTPGNNELKSHFGFKFIIGKWF